MNLHSIEAHKLLKIGGVEVMPFEVMHDELPILGYRVGKLAYITDMKTISSSELKYLEGVETLVVNALRWEREHHSHQLVPNAIAFSKVVGAKTTYLTHLTDKIGLHQEASKRLPANVFLAYDGLVLDV